MYRLWGGYREVKWLEEYRLLLSKGVHPKVVSEMLGHSTVAITLDVVLTDTHRRVSKSS